MADRTAACPVAHTTGGAMLSVQDQPRLSPSSHEVQKSESECGGAFTEVVLVLLTSSKQSTWQLPRTTMEVHGTQQARASSLAGIAGY